MQQFHAAAQAHRKQILQSVYSDWRRRIYNRSPQRHNAADDDDDEGRRSTNNNTCCGDRCWCGRRILLTQHRADALKSPPCSHGAMQLTEPTALVFAHCTEIGSYTHTTHRAGDQQQQQQPPAKATITNTATNPSDSTFSWTVAGARRRQVGASSNCSARTNDGEKCWNYWRELRLYPRTLKHFLIWNLWPHILRSETSSWSWTIYKKWMKWAIATAVDSLQSTLLAV